jgi:hypothetical protein
MGVNSVDPIIRTANQFVAGNMNLGNFKYWARRCLSLDPVINDTAFVEPVDYNTV